MNATNIPLSKLKPNTGQVPGLPKNPRFIRDGRFDALKKSIQDDPEMLDLRELIAYDHAGELVVIAGNMRLRALKELGYKEAPVKVLPPETPAEKLRAYAVKDNVPFGETDWEAMANDWDAVELEAWGLEVPGWDEAETEGEAQEDDYEAPDVIHTDIVLGDLFEIGPHRLMCGDSTDSDAVAKLMGGEKADMVFTDPPYNLQQRGQVKRTNKIKDKRQDFGTWDIGFNPLDVIPNIVLFTKDDANIYICTSSYLFGSIHNELEKIGLKPSYAVWCKNNPMPSLTKNRFVQATELIIHAVKGNPGFDYPEGKNLPNYFLGNVEPHSHGHPTQKPIYVVEYFLKTQQGNVVDFFLGSGSTMVAAHQLNRRCFGMELDPKYCQVILDRMLKLDPALEVKRNGEAWQPTQEAEPAF